MPGPRYIRSGLGVRTWPPCRHSKVSGFDLDPGVRRGGRGLKPVSSRKPRRGYPGPRGVTKRCARGPLSPGSTLRFGRDDTGGSVCFGPITSVIPATRAGMTGLLAWAIGAGEGGVTPHPALRATFSRAPKTPISTP
ncbi:hypothetical protein EIB18_09105 [Caulobacter vibrioides]|nr:hypothetical protein EIB18_09105 [Caulobacter vibrioides]